MKKSFLAAAVVTMGLLGTSSANAAPVLFTGTGGLLSASASFDIVGGNLVVVLTNTSVNDVLVGEDLLTGVFFDLAGVGTLGRVAGVLTAGSAVFYDPNGQPPGGVVGGEFAYAAGLVGPGGATEGISSAGLGLFGSADLFPGSDLEPPITPNGLQYGILSAGDNLGTGNAGVLGSGGLIRNSATFTLSGDFTGIDLATALSNVSFQYGAQLTSPNIPGVTATNVPEPTMLSVLGLGLAAAAYRRRRA